MTYPYNPISKIEPEKSKKYQTLTIRVVDEYFDEFLKLTKIPKNKFKREKKGDLLKDFELHFLPEYENDKNPITCYPLVKINIITDDDRNHLMEILNCKLSDKTKSLWWPERPETKCNKKYITIASCNPKYPIYIISKGRWEKRLTSKSLDEMNCPYYLVVEENEYDKYIEKLPATTNAIVLIFTKEYQDKEKEKGNGGSIPVRNFVWEHSIKNGFQKHWVLDDNIDGFYRWNKNKKNKIVSPIFFKMIEDYMELYDNVKMCGLQYYSFYPEISLSRPIIIKNTRIYSCILIDNNLSHRWRGVYNEDTDLSLRILKDGYSTLLFQNFLCNKQTTMSCKGGNTDSIYKDDGLEKKLHSLMEQHPDVVKETYKFKKIHHQVDYNPFKDNKMIRNNKTYNINDYPKIILE